MTIHGIQGYAFILFENHDILPLLSVVLLALDIGVFFEDNLASWERSLATVSMVLKDWEQFNPKQSHMKRKY